MKDLNTVLITPIITEKASKMKTSKKYAFKIARSANKIEVKKAVESLYKVKVEKVNVALMSPKWKRVRSSYGYTDMWKKAVVTLREGEIDFYKA
jgi:large subunit ribosomal protein L23